MAGLLGGEDAQLKPDWTPPAPGGMNNWRPLYAALSQLVPGLGLNPERRGDLQEGIAMGNRTGGGPSLLSLYSGERLPWARVRPALAQNAEPSFFYPPNPPYQANMLNNSNARVDRLNAANSQWGIPPVHHEVTTAPRAPMAGQQLDTLRTPMGMSGNRDARMNRSKFAIIQDLLSGGNP